MAHVIPKSSWSIEKARLLGAWVILGALMTAIYYPVLARLVTDWGRLPDFSHGFLVPVFAGYLAWSRRATLLATPRTPDGRGVAVVALGLVLLLLGAFGSELFLARVSFLIVTAGGVLSFAGMRLLKELRFILLVLLLGIPLPAICFNQLTFPLQMLASRLGGALLALCGVPVLRQGNILQLPSMTLEVAEACSGIRSLMSLFTLAVFYGFFFESSRWRRVGLVLATLPIAIAANAVRILVTGLGVQYGNPARAMGFFHEFSGWVLFVVSLGCLLIAHRAARVFPLRRGAA